MATTKIWDGTTWRDLEGPQGPAGPTVVSADAVNVAKLGTDGRILVAQADLDARYVNANGDTLSGGLMVYGARTFFAPGDPGEPYSVGFRNKSTGGAVYVGATDATANPGIQLSNAGGLSLLQISNAGNITNTGASHTFAAGSIQSTAISGLPAASTVAGTALAAAGVVGVSTAYARADHVHPFPTAAQVGAITQAQGDARYVEVAGDSMTGPLSIAYNTAPPAEGQLYVTAETQAAASSWTTYNATAATASIVRLRRARGTAAAPASVQSGDTLGFFTTMAHNGTSFIGGGNIRINATKTPAAGETNIQTEWLFNVGTPAGASQQMKLDAAGVTAINVTASNAVSCASVTAINVTASNAVSCASVTATGTAGVTAINVTATGTTKTIALEVASAATFDGPIIHNVTAGIGHTMQLTPPAANSQATGLVVNIQPAACVDSCGVRIVNPGVGTGENIGLFIGQIPADPNNYSIYDGSPAANYFRGNCGINWATPTANLEVQGTARVRGTLEVTGNITSSGTAHAFAAGSIPTSALSGSFGALTASTVSATGGRSNFAPVNEPFAIGLRYNAAGLPIYLGTTATGEFQVSNAGGVPILTIDETTRNITSAGTAHNFANGSIPAAAIKDLPITAQVITQAAYDALAVKSPTVLYLITG